MKIAILGSGAVGRRLAALFTAAGYPVALGRREEARAACDGADLVLLALPYGAVQEVVQQLGDRLTGKIIIDVTNPVQADWSPLILGAETSAAETIARLLPEARIVKAFNTIFADIMTPAGLDRQGTPVTCFIASDDPAAAAEVAKLAGDIGMAPLLVGPLKIARHLEALAHLNIQIAVGQGGGTNAAFLFHQVKQ